MPRAVSADVTPAALRALVHDTVHRALCGLDGRTGCALLIDALAAVRSELLTTDGYRAMRQFDDWLLDNLARRRVRRVSLGGPAVVPLPSGVERAVIPERNRLLLRNVLEVVAVHARSRGVPALHMLAVEVLVDALTDLVAGVPAWEVVIQLLDHHMPSDSESAGVPGTEVRLQ
ncbi:hypothetical protein HRbin40_02319 [bacterium HR40]|nr:hypothetical protein HRbin40_02319 [bacterium HR40]